MLLNFMLLSAMQRKLQEFRTLKWTVARRLKLRNAAKKENRSITYLFFFFFLSFFISENWTAMDYVKDLFKKKKVVLCQADSYVILYCVQFESNGFWTWERKKTIQNCLLSENRMIFKVSSSSSSFFILLRALQIHSEKPDALPSGFRTAGDHRHRV